MLQLFAILDNQIIMNFKTAVKLKNLASINYEDVVNNLYLAMLEIVMKFDFHALKDILLGRSKI